MSICGKHLYFYQYRGFGKSYLHIPRPFVVMEIMLVCLFVFYLSIQMQSGLNWNVTMTTIIVTVVFVFKYNWCNNKTVKKHAINVHVWISCLLPHFHTYKRKREKKLEVVFYSSSCKSSHLRLPWQIRNQVCQHLAEKKVHMGITKEQKPNKNRPREKLSIG